MVRVPFDTATAVGKNIPHAPKCRAGTISNIGFITQEKTVKGAFQNDQRRKHRQIGTVAL